MKPPGSHKELPPGASLFRCPRLIIRRRIAWSRLWAVAECQSCARCNIGRPATASMGASKVAYVGEHRFDTPSHPLWVKLRALHGSSSIALSLRGASGKVPTSVDTLPRRVRRSATKKSCFSKVNAPPSLKHVLSASDQLVLGDARLSSASNAKKTRVGRSRRLTAHRKDTGRHQLPRRVTGLAREAEKMHGRSHQLKHGRQAQALLKDKFTLGTRQTNRKPKPSRLLRVEKRLDMGKGQDCCRLLRATTRRSIPSISGSASTQPLCVEPDIPNGSTHDSCHLLLLAPKQSHASPRSRHSACVVPPPNPCVFKRARLCGSRTMHSGPASSLGHCCHRKL